MKRKLLNAALIAAIVAMAWYVVAHREVEDAKCRDFRNLEEVMIVSGERTGNGALIVGASEKNGECVYKVRGQRGVEMPFVEWYQSWELVSLEG